MKKALYIAPTTEIIRHVIQPLLENASLKVDDEGGDIGGALGKENIWDSEEDMDGLWN